MDRLSEMTIEEKMDLRLREKQEGKTKKLKKEVVNERSLTE